MSSLRPLLVFLIGTIPPLLMQASVPLALPAGDFESGLTSWVVGSSDNGFSTASSTAAFTGSLGLLVTDTSTTTGSWLYSQKVPITPNAAYRLTFWAKVVSGSGLSVYLIFYDSNNQVVASSFSTPVSGATGTWSQYELDATPPAGAASVLVQVHSYISSVVTVALDDFVLSENLRDGGIEEAGAGWTIASDDHGMSAVTASAAHTGVYGLRVTDTSSSLGSSLYSTLQPATPGTTYTLDCQARIVSGGGIGVYLKYYNASRQLISSGGSYSVTVPTSLTTWGQVEISGAAPAGTAYVGAWIHSFSANTVTADFDDFSISQVDKTLDSGFENGLTGWTAGSGDNGMSAAVAAAAHSGSLGLRVTDASTSTGSSLTSALLPALPGQGYELSLWARRVQGAGFGMYLQFYDTNQAALPGQAAIYSMLTSDSTDWRRISRSVVAPAGTAYVGLWLHSYSANTVTADIDDIRLREVPRTWVETFPKNDPDQAYDTLKARASNGSVQRTPLEDWTGAAQRASSRSWATWVAGRKSDIDYWIANNADRVSWVAGWYHDFVSPVDGSRITWTDAVPGEDVTYLYSPTDPHVTITSKIMGGWIQGFRDRHTGYVLEAAKLYRLTGNTTYATWAAGQLDFYANNYLLWPAQNHGGPSQLSYQPLDDAVWITKLVDAARLLKGWAASDRFLDWYDNLFKLGASLLDLSYQSVNNIAAWLRSAQGCVALVYGDDALWDDAIDGPFGLRAQLRLGVTGDYIWEEQSMGYNDYLAQAASTVVIMAGLSGKGAELEQESAILENLLLAPMTLRFPDNTLPNPSDSTSVSSVPSSTLRTFSRVLPTHIGLNLASTALAWDTLVDPQSPSGGSTAMPAVVSQHMQSTRFAQLVANGWQVFFHYGQLVNSHLQDEALNWSATYNGIHISTDPGTVGYGSAMADGYYRRGLCQNVPLVNGNGQSPWDMGDMMTFDATNRTMTAEQLLYQANASAQRTLNIATDGRLIDTATAVCVNGTTATLGVCLNLDGTATLPSDFVTASGFTTGRPAAFGYWSAVTSKTYQDSASINVTFASGQVMTVRFSCPGSFTVYHGTAPGQPPATRCGFYVEKTGTASQATFTTELIPVP